MASAQEKNDYAIAMNLQFAEDVPSSRGSRDGVMDKNIHEFTQDRGHHSKRYNSGSTNEEESFGINIGQGSSPPKLIVGEHLQQNDSIVIDLDSDYSLGT